MRALVFDGRQLRYDPSLAAPKPTDGEALIRTLRAGICSTDLEICRGYMGFTGVPGHEFVGIVEQVQSDKPDAKRWIGRRVVGTINCSCGQCDLCGGGLSGHCRNRTVLGILNRNGCFADRFTLPVRNLLEVPDTLDDDHAVFTEPVAAACQILRQTEISPRCYVTVLGDGRLGLLIAQVLAKTCPRVRVIGKHAAKLSLCEKWGIKHRPLSEITPRADQDVVVDATGSADGLRLAMAMVRPRGRIVLKTTVADQSGVDLSPLVINEVQLIGSRCGPFNEALSMIATGEIDLTGMISRRFPIMDGQQAMQAAADPNNIKVLLEFD